MAYRIYQHSVQHLQLTVSTFGRVLRMQLKLHVLLSSTDMKSCLIEQLHNYGLTMNHHSLLQVKLMIGLIHVTL